MEELNISTKELQCILTEISSELNQIKEDNFNDKINTINLKISKLKEKKANYKNLLPRSEYKEICDLVHRGVKQISCEFDSIIESKKEQQMLISSELSEIVNKKKLINYQR